MKIELLIIGDEITTGETRDSNTSMICKELNKAGYFVERITTIGDKKRCLLQALNEIFERADLVITTGGLGPTSDDITKETLAEFFNSDLIFNQKVFAHIENLYLKKNIKLPSAGISLGLVPEKANIIINPVGTAAVLWFKEKKRQLIALPGVPHETHFIFPNLIIPELGRNKDKKIIHKNIHIAGLRETVIAEKLKDLEKNLAFNIKLSYLPHLTTVKLRLSILTDDDQNDGLLNDTINAIKEKLSDHIYGYDDETLEESLISLLKKNDLSLSVAESCSGGYISHRITEVPGCSQWFKGGITSYSNEAKIALLNVPSKLIESHGAVSQEVAEAMLRGALTKFNSDLAIATTGIAGPGGGSVDKPVGTVWIAAGDRYNFSVKRFVFGNQRHENIVNTALSGMNLLRRFILENKT